MGAVRGDPAPADEVLIQVSNDLVEPNLLDLFSSVASDQAYSYTYDGNMQAIDHILVNPNLMSRFDGLQVARVNPLTTRRSTTATRTGRRSCRTTTRWWPTSAGTRRCGAT